ncbi:tRNA pseudouridine(38-40) synthase TruA [Pareuzebyella sediminis]|uniref:tRNA pseudouridine(38-40) synthase TruA n=1 Tax=Pareuzebyella sediminis TaxID=2607998 RepID=UPI0011EF00E2|nr:tRNA pseudouridine(38-40) synthase TruA [Pareuzebyella sediminis]
MRYFVEFAYVGKAYHGWQNQPNALTVQQVLENSFSTLLRQSVSLTGAGRTDAGVHARQMFAHFEAEGLQQKDDMVYRLNSFLPSDISVKTIFEVNENAHARFDAVSRTYEYWITQEKNPFYVDYAYEVKSPLHVEKMNQAAKLLLEHTDFECFSKSKTDVKTYDCHLRKATWEKRDDVLVFTITADRFLRNMVRAIVGTLIEVGQEKYVPEHVKTVLNSKDRGKAGPSVPAKGLYLISVVYPEKIRIRNG